MLHVSELERQDTDDATTSLVCRNGAAAFGVVPIVLQPFLDPSSSLSPLVFSFGMEMFYFRPLHVVKDVICILILQRVTVESLP